MCTKNIFGLLFGILFLGILSSCSERAQCPAYINMNQGTLSVQDKDKTPEEIRKQSQKLLETQDYYIKVKRSKKTGLVKNSKKVKKGKNNTNRHTGFSNDPRTLKGVK
ncbi:MAG: hypothetical protein NW226_24095 [Microscillaceae bacterium]|nr:hypothetical protein [Microscillaceae bacterium]